MLQPRSRIAAEADGGLAQPRRTDPRPCSAVVCSSSSKGLSTSKSISSITGLPGAIGLFDEGARVTMVGMVGARG
jgi:hypothetical protein